MQKNYYKVSLLSIALLITITRIVFLYKINLPLWVDEAQYWFWSRNLQAGYYSKPPFIAWLIRFTTDYLGVNEFGVRFSAPIIHFIVTYLVYLTAKEAFDQKTAYFSALTYITLPAVTFSSSFISADAPLMLFWALGLYAFVKINKNYQYSSFYYWIIFAFSLGFGMLIKYTFIAFAFSVVIYYLFNRFSALFSLNFIGSCLLGVMIFIPNILWNYNNDFVSFSHTSDNVLSKGVGVHPKDMLEFLGAQFVVFGIFLLLFLVPSFFQKNTYPVNKKLLVKDTFNPVKLLNYFTIPILFAGVLTSFISSAQAHWAAPAYISGSILVVNYFLHTDKKFWLNFSLLLNAVMFALFLNMQFIVEKIAFIKDPLERVYVWHKPAGFLKYYNIDEKNSIILADERKIIAPLIYDLKVKNNQNISVYKFEPSEKIGDYYDMTCKYTIGNNKKIYLISRTRSEEDFNKYFGSVRKIKTLDEKYNLNIYEVLQ